MFVWSRNGTNRTKAYVKGLLAPEMKMAVLVSYNITSVRFNFPYTNECQSVHEVYKGNKA